MRFFDIHTHIIPSYPQHAIVSYQIEDEEWPDVVVYASVGIHPWFLSETNASIQLARLKALARRQNVVAMGEAGLDKMAEASLDVQISVLRQEIILAEELSLPMVIHCVRAFNELLSLKKEMKPKQPWVIHGFRGKRELAEMCLRQGCYLSFGAKFQEEALRMVPADRLLIETDMSEEPLEEIYARVAEVRGISLQELTDTVMNNVTEVFFKH